MPVRWTLAATYLEIELRNMLATSFRLSRGLTVRSSAGAARSLLGLAGPRRPAGQGARRARDRGGVSGVGPRFGPRRCPRVQLVVRRGLLTRARPRARAGADGRRAWRPAQGR